MDQRKNEPGEGDAEAQRAGSAVQALTSETSEAARQAGRDAAILGAELATHEELGILAGYAAASKVSGAAAHTPIGGSLQVVR